MFNVLSRWGYDSKPSKYCQRTWLSISTSNYCSLRCRDVIGRRTDWSKNLRIEITKPRLKREERVYHIVFMWNMWRRKEISRCIGFYCKLLRNGSTLFFNRRKGKLHWLSRLLHVIIGVTQCNNVLLRSSWFNNESSWGCSNIKNINDFAWQNK